MTKRWLLRAALLLVVAVFIPGCRMMRNAGDRTGSGSSQVIYDSEQDDARAIADALKLARSTGRKVLLCFGANWCSDSQAMHRLLTGHLRIRRVLQQHYILVHVDAGKREGPRWDTPLVRQYGSPFARRGIPAFVILDADGGQLTNGENNPLKDEDHKHPRRVLRFLRKWAVH